VARGLAAAFRALASCALRVSRASRASHAGGGGLRVSCVGGHGTFCAWRVLRSEAGLRAGDG